MRPGRCLGAVLLLALPGCTERASPPRAEHASLGGSVVARVADEAIPAGLVAEVARAQSISKEAALEGLIADALAARGARAQGLDRTPEVALEVRAARARRVIAALRDRAEAQGPPDDAEVRELTEAHWLEVDLPERMKVVHAVVLKPKEDALAAKAAKVAGAIAAAAALAPTPEDFETQAKAVDAEGLTVKVERLDPFVADGRIASPAGGGYDPDFVRGAVPLPIGGTSGVVRSPFGWHVIRMIDRIPEHRVPLEERRRMFHDEVMTGRARRAKEKLLADLADREHVALANGSDQLMTEAAMATSGGQASLSQSQPAP